MFNPSADPLTVHCRLHDKRHVANNFSSDDRFRRLFVLKQGWNELTIPLQDVLKAPSTRTMKMDSMCNVGFFVAGLEIPHEIYIDHVRLLR